MSDIFTQVIETLLAGEVVCRYTREPLFEYLENEDNFERVHDYLFKIGRKVRATTDGDGYLLAHADLASNRARREARYAFEEISRYIRPFVYWLSLAKKLSPTGNPIKAGDVLDEAELLRAIGESADLTRELDSLKTLYRATARLSVFYDMIAFIRDYEQLADPEDDDEQMELLDG